MKARAVVVGLGARTPIGLEARSTAFLYRAAHMVMQQSPLLDVHGEPAVMALLPTVDLRLTGAARAAELALPALDQVLAPVKAHAGRLRLKLVVCVDEPLMKRGDDGAVPAHALVNRLARRAAPLAASLDIETSALGPAAPGLLLDGLFTDLERGKVDAVVLGGVHTDYDPARIIALSRARRLLTTEQLDALIPGECAAFALLMSRRLAGQLGLQPLAQLHATGSGHSEARPDNDASAFEAAGLTAAVRQAAAPMREDTLRCGWLLTDLTFETLRLHELQAMCARTQQLWCEPQYYDAPAQRLGHLGAATMVLHWVLAAESWRAGFGPHGRAMSLAGSDAGQRAAVLLSAP